MHAIEKILAKAAGLNNVSAGDIVVADVDLAEVNDIYLQSLTSFYEIGGERVWDPSKVAFVFDHYAPSPTVDGANNHKLMRQFVKEQGILHLFDVHKGVCHQVLPEAGLVYPGMVLVATDSHTTTHGAFGAFGTGVGATDIAIAMKDGKLWFKVPKIVKIQIDGIPSFPVLAKDVALYIIGQLKSDGAIYQVIEFTGSYIDSLSISSKMVLCNMAVEMGAKTSYIQPNNAVIEYVKSRTSIDFEVPETDADYEYNQQFAFDVSHLKPQVSIPHSVDLVKEATFVLGQKVDQCLIGTCTGGRVEDFLIADKVIDGRKIASSTRLLLVPASDEVLSDCIENGSIPSLLKAGATLVSPGCGPCLGAHEGVLAPEEVCISTSNRNFPGRMGSRDAEIYLASPAVVAESAVHGFISVPNYTSLLGKE